MLTVAIVIMTIAIIRIEFSLSVTEESQCLDQVF